MAHTSLRKLSIPVGTKYVLEKVGPFVRRYIEFPNGERIKLPTRKAKICEHANLQTSIVPDQVANAFNVQTRRRRTIA